MKSISVLVPFKIVIAIKPLSDINFFSVGKHFVNTKYFVSIIMLINLTYLTDRPEMKIYEERKILMGSKKISTYLQVNTSKKLITMLLMICQKVETLLRDVTFY